MMLPSPSNLSPSSSLVKSILFFVLAWWHVSLSTTKSEAFVLLTTTTKKRASTSRHRGGSTLQTLQVVPFIVQEDSLELSTGVNGQVLYSFPETTSQNQKPPLVFVHGSFHAAWCWKEHWFEYFATKGYPVLAVSLRGTGGTFAGEGIKKVKIDQHAADLQAFLTSLQPLIDSNIIQRSRQQETTKPVLVSHSFGGAVVMKYLERYPEEMDMLSGIATFCSVPPSGNGPMTMRFLRRSWQQSWKITAGFAMKQSITNAALCRDLFFGGSGLGTDDDDFGVSDDDVARYQTYFARDTEATIDVGDFVKHLPSKNLLEDGRAAFFDKLPPCLVVGATRDYIVDKEGVDETAVYFLGTNSKPIFVDSPHDVMLGRDWKEGAKALNNWLEGGFNLAPSGGLS